MLKGKKALVADMLFELGAIKFGEFHLKLHETQPDAPPSPIYLNLRTADHPKNPGPLTEEVMNLIGDLFADSIKVIGFAGFDCYADIPEAGAPFGDQIERIVAQMRPRPRRLRLHKVFLPDGKRQISLQVDGMFEAGERCLVVDEMITQADTKLEACRAIVANGLTIAIVLVLVDRQQGGGAQLAAAGYKLHAVLGLDELLDHYVETGMLDEGKAQEVRDYIAANQAA